MGKYDNHKEILFIQGIPQSSRFYLYIGSERSASQAYPFCWHADKMQDKGFQPACLFQWLDLIADMKDEIEIEVLQHGGNHHENHVLSHKGKGQMRPSEVIVLYIEVLFACSTLIVECNDVLKAFSTTKVTEEERAENTSITECFTATSTFAQYRFGKFFKAQL